MEKRANGFLVLLLGVVIGASGGSFITYHATRAQIHAAEVGQDISRESLSESASNTSLAFVETPDPTEKVLPKTAPSFDSKPAEAELPLEDFLASTDDFEENDTEDDSSQAYSNAPESELNDRVPIAEQESEQGTEVTVQENYDPYERLLSPTESNKVFNHFQERYAEFAKQEKTDEHAHIAQSFQDYFDIYVVSEDAQLDKAECRVNACELRISSPNTSFSVPGKVFDIVKELDIKAKGMQGVDSYDVELERKIYMLLIEMEEFEG
ncbi:hypothetical protein GCE9029_03447 [Grimontia celer]|uniref:Uncharacterized protein n=1 Tax=Grimontia celer TaxID=1796497 RepID=A0A128F7T5_9GAMM|nr:hypothetical protein [Grimontia celer]CZF82798.1 hypothetical protein GCE9029_03447 [Grimontia celer]